jgi:transcriptional regulator with XRE-family HTH domain
MSTTAPLAQLIGERVRNERLSRAWSLDRLAEAAEVSRRMLINIEQGTANPSIGILLKLSDALGVGLPSLVEPPATAALKLTRTGTAPVLWSSEGGGRALLVAGTEPPDVVELWDWTLGPGDRYASDAHATGTRELLHVQAGTVVVEIGAQALTLETGDALSFRGDGPHAYANPAAGPARFSLSVFEPAVGSSRPGGVRRA